jgi:GxxExxY protein
MDRTTLDELSELVIGAVFEVANSLGPGFLEKVYERALLQELNTLGMTTESQVPFSIMYKGSCVGEYLPDILVERSLLVELKCVDRFCDEHMAQCMNYLKASGITVCLLVNFQRARVEWKRVVLGY